MEHFFGQNLRFYYERSGYIMTGRDFVDDVYLLRLNSREQGDNLAIQL